ncbi:MAG: NADH-quinone oxidoreductase subunit H, partial [Candidatus Eremiobacterota bacterium]
VATTLFLGGWTLFGLEKIIPPFLIFLSKVLALIFVIIWFRWTFPRLRVDQLMNFCWKVLLPLSLINLVFTGLLSILGLYNIYHF